MPVRSATDPPDRLQKLQNNKNFCCKKLYAESQSDVSIWGILLGVIKIHNALGGNYEIFKRKEIH
jgi:hypothetical protein